VAAAVPAGAPEATAPIDAPRPVAEIAVAAVLDTAAITASRAAAARSPAVA
jgi:hypothetical protein